MEFQRTTQQWSIGGSRIKWSAVFAGLVVGMAAQMTFTLLGLAIGAWSLDFHDPQAAQGISTGTAIYTAVTLLISAFIGGFVTARLAGSYLRSDGLFHGVVVWGLTCMLSAFLATTAMASLVGGIFSMFGTVLQGLGQGAASAAASVAERAPADPNLLRNLRAEIESALQATGKPELQPGDISQDAERVAEEAKGRSPGEITDTALAEVQNKLNALDREA
jgi:MFS family permease